MVSLGEVFVINDDCTCDWSSPLFYGDSKQVEAKKELKQGSNLKESGLVDRA